ncbi:hypothetical protein ASF78_20065 [Cellulomonas sp. Leaf334]|nr:hypothetical protein ASF78_20065 [Cellulomonas sp. Leaf334]
MSSDMHAVVEGVEDPSGVGGLHETGHFLDVAPRDGDRFLGLGQRLGQQPAAEHECDDPPSHVLVDACQSLDLDSCASLFLDFAHDCVLDCLAEFEHAPRRLPPPVVAAVDQQDTLAGGVEHDPRCAD